MKAKEALAQADPPLPAMAGERPAGEPKKVVEAASTAQSGGEDMEKKLEEEFKRDVETYRAKIEDLIGRMNNATTVEQLLRSDVEWGNLLKEMNLKSSRYYRCDEFYGEEHFKRDLVKTLHREVREIEWNTNAAARRISGKANFEDLLAGGGSEETWTLFKRIFDEMASDELKKAVAKQGAEGKRKAKNEDAGAGV
jgi:hypothetical protein